MGPVSLAALKCGEVNLPYDGKFAFAEVNADKVHWVINEHRKMEKVRVEKYRYLFKTLLRLDFNSPMIFQRTAQTIKLNLNAIRCTI